MDVQSSVVFRNEYYKDTIRQQTAPKRLISAPYLYCSFAASIILIGIGTYVSAYAYRQTDVTITHTSLQYVGPVLIGCGGVTLLAMCMICVVAFRLNQGQIFYEEMEHPMAIGASTFYGQPVLHQSRHVPQDGLYNEDLEYEDGLRFLERTVSKERQRKISKNSTLPRNNSNEIVLGTEMLSSNHRRNSSFKHLGLDSLRRTEPVEELSSYYDSSQNVTFGTPPTRTRSMSMAHRQKPSGFQRNLSLNPNEAYIHRQNLRTKRQMSNQLESGYPPELQVHGTTKTPSSPFLSLKRKRNNKKKNDVIPVCRLPNYDPGLINNLMNKPPPEQVHEGYQSPKINEGYPDYKFKNQSAMEEVQNSRDGPILNRSTSTLERRKIDEKHFDSMPRSTPTTPNKSSSMERRRKKKRKTRSSLRAEFSDSKHSSGCTCSSTSEEENERTTAITQSADPPPIDDMPPPSAHEAIGVIQSVIESQMDSDSLNEIKRLSIINESGHEEEKAHRVSPPRLD